MYAFANGATLAINQSMNQLLVY